MRIIGLTGGTGSGKSEAAKRFAEHGIPVIDADRVGHELIAPGGSCVDEVVQSFGASILTDGAIDRDKLGALVFAEDNARATLNAILHPAIQREIALRCAHHAQDGAYCAIIDAALLAEGGTREPFLNGLILVLCDAEERVRRLVTRTGLSESEARQRIAAQSPPENKVALADWVIHNEGAIETLWDQVDRIAAELRTDG